MRNKIKGYIVNSKNDQPLSLCPPRYSGDNIPTLGVLLRGNGVTMFERRKSASDAIKRTVIWADSIEGTFSDKDNWSRIDNFEVFAVRAQGE